MEPFITGETKMTTTKKRSERDDFLLNYTIRKDCERRRAERDELQKKASAYGNNEKPETAPQRAVKNQ